MARSKVKLDTKGLQKFANTFGKKGVTFTVGLFDPESARKGALLEFGDSSNNQPARPWLSMFGAKGTNSNKELSVLISDYVKTAIEGRNRRAQTARKITTIVKKFVTSQDFPAATGVPLKDSTVKRKAKKGRSNPELVGIDSKEMLRSLKTIFTKKDPKKLKKK